MKNVAASENGNVRDWDVLSKNTQVAKSKQERSMPKIFDAESTIHVNKVLSGLHASETLNVTVVYDDASSRRWAGDVLQQAETSLGNRSMRATWWNLADL